MDATSAPLAAPSETDRYRRKRAAIVAAASDIINHKGVKGMTLADVAGSGGPLPTTTHKGVKGMTLADVAACVGLITTSVTYYFKKKEALAEACFQDAIDRLDALITGRLAAPGRAARR